MKKVFRNTDEVIHVFAQRTQYEGQNQSRSIFFYGDKIYSYGHHYLLGEFIDDKTILINDKGYSRTTAEHIGKLRFATNHYRQFFVTRTNIDLVYDEVNALLKKIEASRKAQTKKGYINTIISLEYSLTSYLKYVKDKETLKSVKYKSIVKYAKIVQDDTLLIDLEHDLNKAKKEARRFNIEKTKKAINDFYQGSLNYLNNIPHALLRLSKEGDTIETSRGANVPLNEAKILYHRINTGKCIKGFKIGHYTTIGIKDNTIKIGCHDIKLEEVHKLKEVLS